MYGLIRLCIGCIVFGCIKLKFKELIKTRRHKIYILVIAAIFSIIFMFIPFENLFITFSSPEKVFNYCYTKKTKVKLVVEGKDSDLVIGEDDDAHIYLIVPKVANGWKIGMWTNTKLISYEMYNSISVDVYQYKNTNDYFVSILDMNGGYSQITDSFQSEFSALEQPMDVLEKTYVTYYTNIQDFTDEYWINVNGEKIIVT